MGARGVSSEHVENMEMFSGSPLRCSPDLQLRCALVLEEPCSGSRRTVLRFSKNRALVLGEPCPGSRRTVLRFSENRALVLSYLSYPILVQADPLIKRALDKYFKDHNQRDGGQWRMYHSDETRFYQTDDSKVTRRLLKEKSKLTFVDV